MDVRTELKKQTGLTVRRINQWPNLIDTPTHPDQKYIYYMGSAAASTKMQYFLQHI